MVNRKLIETWLKNTSQLIKQRIKEGLDVSIKTSLSDLVTNVDKEVESLFCQFIAQHYPTHKVLGEESCSNVDCKNAKDLWVIDPIDGTLNFVKSQQNFVIMVSYFHNGIGQLGFIYDVMSDDSYVAIKGVGAFKNNLPLPQLSDDTLEQSIIGISANLFFKEHIHANDMLKKAASLRMVGSAGQSMLAVFNGHFNGYFSVKLQPWDYLAGIIFADVIGLPYSTIDNKPIPMFEPTTLVLGTTKVYNAMINNITID